MRSTIGNTIRAGAIALAVIAVNGRAARGQDGQTRKSHAPTCASALTAYSSFAAVPSPHDTLRIPPLSGSWNSAEAMAAARADAMARIGATGYVVETKTMSEPGSPISRTMSRYVPVFVPAEEAKVRAACATSAAQRGKPPSPR